MMRRGLDGSGGHFERPLWLLLCPTKKRKHTKQTKKYGMTMRTTKQKSSLF